MDAPQLEEMSQQVQGAFHPHTFVVTEFEDGKHVKTKEVLETIKPKTQFHPKSKRPQVKYLHPVTKEVSGAVHFGTDVFISAGLKPDGTDHRVSLKQDEENNLIVYADENGLPADSYTIQPNITGMVSRLVVSRVIPALASQRKNFVRVASVVLPIVKFNDGSEFLLLTQRVTRKGGTYNNFWVFPGGHVEEGETLEQGGMREVKEETGLALEEDRLDGLCVWQEYLASRKKQLQFIIANFSTVIHVKEDLTQEQFLLTLGLQLKEVKRCVLMPRSTWGILAEQNSRYKSHTKEDIVWPEQEAGAQVTEVLGVENEKNHVALAKIPTEDVYHGNPGIGPAHSFAVKQLVRRICAEGQ